MSKYLRVGGLAVLGALVACGGSKATSKGVEKPVEGSGGDGVEGATSEMDQPTPLDPRVRIGKLANGLTYYVIEHPVPQKRAYLWMGVNAGSVLEDDDQQGLAHFVEHMAFNGTKNFKKAAIVNYFESIGMRFGADLNAYTSFNETVYMIKVPTDDQKFLDTGMAILRDWAGNISFEPEEVEKERGVVGEELRLGKGAGERIRNKQFPILFKGSVYAERLPIGKSEILKNAPVEALTRFYKDWYRPDLMAIVAVGDFDGDKIEAQIKQTFGDLKNPENPRERKPALVAPHDELLVGLATDKEQPTTIVRFHYKLPHRRESTLGDYRGFIVQNMLGSLLNARLRERSQQPDSPIVFGGLGIGELTRTADSFDGFAVAKTGQAEAALELLLVELERARQHGFGDSELERVRAEFIRSSDKSAIDLKNRDGREFASEMLRNFFEGEQVPGRELEAQYNKRFAPTITSADVNALLAEATAGKSQVVLISGPPTDKMPTQDSVRALVGKVGRRKHKPYKDNVSDQPLMTVKPAAGAVIGESKVAELGVIEWKLSNGAHVIIKPTDFKNDEVEFRAFSPGGTSVAKDADYGSARFASQLIGFGGVGEFDRIQLGKLLSGKVANVSAFIGELEEGMQGGGSPKDLETIMQLIHLRFTAPRKDEKAFATWKAQTLDRVKNRRMSPRSVFFEDTDAAFTQKHKRRRPVTPEMIEAVDLSKAYDFYRDRFEDASDFTFTFVGTIDPKKMKPLVELYLASLPSTGRKEKWRDVNVRHPRGVKNLKIKRGVEQKATVFLRFHGPERWSPQAANDMRMLNEVLNMRLREVLREDLGGVYGVSAFGSISRRPKEQRGVGVFFGCDPARIDELKKALFAEIKAIQKNGIGDDYIAKIKEIRVRGIETSLNDNSFWTRRLSQAYRFGDDPKEILNHQKWTDEVSSARVKAAARKYIKMNQYFLSVLVPEKATK